MARFAADFELGGITALFGPNGSGKTALLRVIAGLDREADGSVRFGEETWQDSARGLFVPAAQRGVGLVFQDGRLFAHLTGSRLDAPRVAASLAADYTRPGRPDLPVFLKEHLPEAATLRATRPKEGSLPKRQARHLPG